MFTLISRGTHETTGAQMNKVRESFERYFNMRVATWDDASEWLKEFDNMDLIPVKQEPEIEPCYLHPNVNTCALPLDKDVEASFVKCIIDNCWCGPVCQNSEQAIAEWNKLMRLARGVR